MRKTAAALLLPLLFILFVPPSSSPVHPQSTALKGRISLSGAWALYPMAVKWAEEFQKLHLKVKIDVQAGGAGKGIADVLARMVDVGMVSREIHPIELERGAFPIAVTKDAVVPTINKKNPFLVEILKRGITREQCIDIWVTGKMKTWGEILGTKEKAALHVFTRSDACGAAETWAAFMGARQEDLLGIGVYGDPGLADAVKRDPLGIGFNNINYAYDAKTERPVEGIIIAPLDLNGNGTIDREESIYDTRGQIIEAIAANVYPSPPARDLYLVTKAKPAKAEVVEFIRWVLAEGQKYVLETGYIPLSKEKLKEGLNRIEDK